MQILKSSFDIKCNIGPADNVCGAPYVRHNYFKGYSLGTGWNRCVSYIATSCWQVTLHASVMCSVKKWNKLGGGGGGELPSHWIESCMYVHTCMSFFFSVAEVSQPLHVLTDHWPLNGGLS